MVLRSNQHLVERTSLAIEDSANKRYFSGFRIQ